MGDSDYRTERDSMGEVRVPANALWGAQTERARQNFALSPLTLPRAFIRALGLIKWAAAVVNRERGALKPDVAAAIEAAALAVAAGEHDLHFPLDVFQTGSGTSTNMNANEVIAHLAGRALGRPVHPNDDVNNAQSSNDVIPTAIHVAAALTVSDELLPALAVLAAAIRARGVELAEVTKTGRTHLMDAMPVTFGQELSGWCAQVESGMARLRASLPRVLALAQGGTAVGTGINAPADFGSRVAAKLCERTGLAFRQSDNLFEALSSQDSAVELSGQLKVIAVSFTKIANDLRWMNSGPLAGLGEIALPALQPGSSIMPGKVNPVIPEAVAMVAAQVIGQDLTVTLAGQSGNFQLNVMLPVIAHNLLTSIALLTNAARALASQAIAGFKVNTARVAEALDRNPILVTALNERIGYERGAQIAKQAYAEGRPIREVAARATGIPESELKTLLDPRKLTHGGSSSGGGGG